MDNNKAKVVVLDVKGKQISRTSVRRALRFVLKERAKLIGENPLTIQLLYEVNDEKKD